MYLFSSGTARGGTGLPVNILGSHPQISLSQDPFLPLWKHFRSDLLLQSDLSNIPYSNPLDDYYYSPEKTSHLECIQAANLIDVNISNLASFKSMTHPRTSLSSANLIQYIDSLKGSNYLELVQSCLHAITDASSHPIKLLVLMRTGPLNSSLLLLGPFLLRNLLSIFAIFVLL